MKKGNLIVLIIVGIVLIGGVIYYFGINSNEYAFEDNDFKSRGDLNDLREFDTRPMESKLTDEEILEITQFFDLSPSESELENYCQENMNYCINYCREINS